MPFGLILFLAFGLQVIQAQQIFGEHCIVVDRDTIHLFPGDSCRQTKLDSIFGNGEKVDFLAKIEDSIVSDVGKKFDTIYVHRKFDYSLKKNVEIDPLKLIYSHLGLQDFREQNILAIQVSTNQYRYPFFVYCYFRGKTRFDASGGGCNLVDRNGFIVEISGWIR